MLIKRACDLNITDICGIHKVTPLDNFLSQLLTLSTIYHPDLKKVTLISIKRWLLWNFPHFFPTCLARRKEWEISKAGKNRGLESCSNIFFPLVLFLFGSFLKLRTKNKNVCLKTYECSLAVLKRSISFCSRSKRFWHHLLVLSASLNATEPWS